MKISIKVIANSSRQEVKEENGVLKVHLKSPPVKGKANEELIEVLAEHFNVKKNQIAILKGHKSNLKEIEVLNK